MRLYDFILSSFGNGSSFVTGHVKTFKLSKKEIVPKV